MTPLTRHITALGVCVALFVLIKTVDPDTTPVIVLDIVLGSMFWLIYEGARAVLARWWPQ